jgi:glycine C-acetyltransferase/8-amino-7-oxononanoate synthase
MNNLGHNPWNHFFERSLKWHCTNDLSRSLKIVDSPQSTRILINGCEYLHFSSNDYLGLANSSLLKARSGQVLQMWGTGSGASPLISGHSRLAQELEDSVAHFKESEAALVFPSGYAANVGVISQLAGPEDLILSDALNHASIVDGCRLSRAKVIIYPHLDLEYVKHIMVQYHGQRKILVVTDAVFSMDGDLAPLPDLYALCCHYGALLYVDDAHGTGVLGEQGKGSLTSYGLPENEVVQIGTFSKALGSLGGFVAGSKLLVEYLIHTARSFIYSTALPPSILAANLEALRIVESEEWRRKKLTISGQLLRKKLEDLGLTVGGQVNHILTILVGSTKETIHLAAYLLDQRIYIPPIRPPTVPKDQSRLRISVSSAHEPADLEALMMALEAFWRLGA